MSKRKNIIVLSCMIALLAVTAVFNFVLTTGTTNSTDSAVITTANYFSQYRNERLTTRNEELMHLDQIIESSSEGSLERSEALNMKIELTEITETEMLLESLIKAYGFEDVVVVMGMESNNINVIAKSSNLTTDEAIVIYSIIAEETGTTPENVKIIPIS